MKIHLRCTEDSNYGYGYITNYGSFCFSPDWSTFAGNDNKRYIKIAKRLKIKRLV